MWLAHFKRCDASLARQGVPALKSDDAAPQTLSQEEHLIGSPAEGKSWYAVLEAKAYEAVKPGLRWLYLTNAKDFGTMCLAYSLSTGFIGLAFSVLLRMELLSPGVSYESTRHRLVPVAWPRMELMKLILRNLLCGLH